MRGMLTDTVREIAKKFLDRDITEAELRLYPYIADVMMNDRHLNRRFMRDIDHQIVTMLNEEKHIIGGVGELTVTPEFWMYIQEVIYLSYVVFDTEEVTS